MFGLSLRAGIVEDDTFIRPWENLPDTIYARPLVKPGDKVRQTYVGCWAAHCLCGRSCPITFAYCVQCTPLPFAVLPA